MYNNKLFVIVTDDHKIITYNIDSDGITFEDEILTNSSMPREMVIINDKIYFTNLETQDIKIFDIINNKLEESTISINGRPEDIIFDGTYIWVSVPEISKWDFNYGTKVAKIDPISNEIIEYIEVRRGPQNLISYNNTIYISRTFYDSDWNPFYGSSKIGTEKVINNYGSGGGACGGSVMVYNEDIYRSFEGGIAPLKDNLEIDNLNRIGSYTQDQIYQVEIINDNIWFCITNWSNLNLVKVVNNNGQEIASYNVGIGPGDLAYWKKSE